MTIFYSHILGRRRRGFTLIEALMASAILATAVVAVTWAITAGQQHAFEARQRIVSTLLAEKTIGQLDTVEYVDLASSYDVESLVWIEVTEVLEDLPNVDVRAKGKRVTVQVFASDATVLAQASRFIPEPGP